MYGSKVGPPIVPPGVGTGVYGLNVGPPIVPPGVGAGVYGLKVGPPLVPSNVGAGVSGAKVGPPFVPSNVGAGVGAGATAEAGAGVPAVHNTFPANRHSHRIGEGGVRRESSQSRSLEGRVQSFEYSPLKKTPSVAGYGTPSLSRRRGFCDHHLLLTKDDACLWKIDDIAQLIKVSA